MCLLPEFIVAIGFGVAACLLPEFIITMAFGGCGTWSIRGCVLFCSNYAAVCGSIKEIQCMCRFCAIEKYTQYMDCTMQLRIAQCSAMHCAISYIIHYELYVVPETFTKKFLDLHTIQN